jgi:hypothetical protein
MKPWWADGAYEYVAKHLNSNSFVFEWGSGNSTLCISKICKIVTVENNAEWHHKLAQKLNPNIMQLFSQCVLKSDNDPGDVDGYTSDSKFYNRIDFEEYVRLIDSFKLFDLVIIDGRARTSCIKHAIPHVKKGGFLLLDDYWRPHYRSGIDLIPDSWARVDFVSAEHKTAIWRF